MPWGDRTGPEGRGPRTGRRLGFCSGYDSPGFTKGNPRGGAGFGREFRGRGYWRNRPLTEYPEEPMPVGEPKETRKDLIQEEIKDIEDELKYLKSELKRLK